MLDVIKMNTRNKGAHCRKFSCKADTLMFVKIRSQEFPCFNLASVASLRESVLVPAMRYFAVTTATCKTDWYLWESPWLSWYLLPVWHQPGLWGNDLGRPLQPFADTEQDKCSAWVWASLFTETKEHRLVCASPIRLSWCWVAQNEGTH